MTCKIARLFSIFLLLAHFLTITTNADELTTGKAFRLVNALNIRLHQSFLDFSSSKLTVDSFGKELHSISDESKALVGELHSLSGALSPEGEVDPALQMLAEAAGNLQQAASAAENGLSADDQGSTDCLQTYSTFHEFAALRLTIARLLMERKL